MKNSYILGIICLNFILACSDASDKILSDKDLKDYGEDDTSEDSNGDNDYNHGELPDNGEDNTDPIDGGSNSDGNIEDDKDADADAELEDVDSSPEDAEEKDIEDKPLEDASDEDIGDIADDGDEADADDFEDSGESDVEDDISYDVGLIDGGDDDDDETDAGLDAGNDAGEEPEPETTGSGIIVYSRESPISQFWPAPNRIYTTSPSIVVLPNGNYLISFNLFGDSLDPSAESSGTTYIYRSTDKGNTWTNLTASPMMDMKRGSLFVHENEVYILGYTAAPGNVVIRKSSDNGNTWTKPKDANSGQLTTTAYGGTPLNPVFLNGRLWTSIGGKRIMSAPEGKNLLDASNWAGPSKSANTDNSPLGKDLVISEAQIVASPQTGVVVMPKIDGLAYTVLIRAVGNKTVADTTEDDWVALPGGDKKFAAAYDSVSKRFYVLSNPVLPEHANHIGLTPQLIRNTGAILSSKDLLHWDVEKIFIYTANISYEAFQYFNFDFEGNDMIIVSRTAFHISGNKPPRGHDSNMIAFHRISDFRNISPRHFLTISDNKVLRYEKTHHTPAPLGPFTIGSVFGGSTLGKVNALSQDSNGDVYIREQSGTILRFDAIGNYIEKVASSPAQFTSGELLIRQPAYGERAWIKDGAGNWDDLSNWYYWGRPDSNYEIANFGSAISSGKTIAISKSYVMKGVRFRSPNKYALSGEGEIFLEADKGSCFIEALQGSHNIETKIKLSNETYLFAESGSELSLNGNFDMNGQTLLIKGGGTSSINGAFKMKGGKVILNGIAPLTFSKTSSAQLDGDLKFLPDSSVSLALHGVYKLIEGANNLSGAFNSLDLPSLSQGQKWDTTNLYTQGTIKIVPDA